MVDQGQARCWIFLSQIHFIMSTTQWHALLKSSMTSMQPLIIYINMEGMLHILLDHILCSHPRNSLTSFLFPFAVGTLIALLQMTVKLQKFFYVKWTGRMLRLSGAHLVLRCFGLLIHCYFETEALA